MFLYEQTSVSQMINEINFFCKNVRERFSEIHCSFVFQFSFGEREKRLRRIVGMSHGIKVLLKISSRGLNLLNSSKNMYRTFYIKRNPIPYEFVLHFLKDCSWAQAMVGLTHQKKSILTVWTLLRNEWLQLKQIFSSFASIFSLVQI